MSETVFTKTRRNLAGVQSNMMITDPDRPRVLAGMACCTLGNEMYELLEKLTDPSNCKKDIIHLIGNAESLLAKARGETK